MNNCKCSKCGRPFRMGVTGVYTDNGDLCDGCANISRQPNGNAYRNDAPFEIFRPIANIGQGGARVRPGDVAQVHPNRGTK